MSAGSASPGARARESSGAVIRRVAIRRGGTALEVEADDGVRLVRRCDLTLALGAVDHRRFASARVRGGDVEVTRDDGSSERLGPADLGLERGPAIDLVV